MKDLTISQLWNAHWANPNDTVIRGQIFLRDKQGARQLWPFNGSCLLSETSQTLRELSDRCEELEVEDDEYKRLVSKNEDLESQVEDLEDKVERLETELEEARK